MVEKIDKKLESMRRIKGEQVGLILTDRGRTRQTRLQEQYQRSKIPPSHKAMDGHSKIKITNQKIKNESYEWRDFAILVRANSHAEPFTRALARFHIPYHNF